jgi:hypothetical protein
MTNFVGMRVVFMEIKSGMDFVVNVIEKFINKPNKYKKHMMENPSKKIYELSTFSDMIYEKNRLLKTYLKAQSS